MHIAYITTLKCKVGGIDLLFASQIIDKVSPLNGLFVRKNNRRIKPDSMKCDERV